MKFSLIIPCYNEAKNIPALLERCREVGNFDGEVILVDNGSSDNTVEVLKELLPKYPGCRSIRVEDNIGYGFGVLEGLKAAEGDILGWTHADLQTDPLDVISGIKIFEVNGLDIFVKGRRYGRPAADTFFTVGMSFFETILMKTWLWDINAQPNLFTRRFYESWINPPHDFSLDLFVFYQAKLIGLPIFRFPVKFGERLHGVSHWNVDWTAKKRFIRRTIAFSIELKKRGLN
jgi:glycosyltransferase involved in cell wall biosynthesis